MWEYKVIETGESGVPLKGEQGLPYSERLKNGLNEIGEDGWELCGTFTRTLIFKRQKRSEK